MDGDLREAVRGALDGLRGTMEQIRAPSRREVLALTTTPGLASLWLIPRLEAFISEHPGIDVRIDASLAKRNLSSDGYDLAIRYASVDSSVGTSLFHETVQPVCAPTLARDRARPLKTPADLRHHTLLDVEVQMGAEVLLEWDLWAKAMGLGATRCGAHGHADELRRRNRGGGRRSGRSARATARSSTHC